MISVVYWTMTGNTEAMANAVAEGIKEAGGEAEVVEVGSANAADLAAEPCFALGAPAMGDEELDADMDAFVSEVEKICAGKKIALFGSYDWGDGQWMRTWTERMKNAGAEIVNGEGLICNLTPDDDGVAACKALGAALAK